ncbi:MAG: serine hydrolase [Elusimicrobiales bacterium]
MKRDTANGARSLAACRAVLAALALACGAPATAADYHVSYLWHSDRAAATAYRERLAALLGPATASRLKVVKGADNYGVVYARSGGREGAAAVARAHSRILASKGLHPAVPVQAGGWGAPALVPVPEPAPAAAAAQPAATAGMEKRIEDYVRTLRRRGVVKADERTAWVVYDFSTGEKLVSINEDLPLDAASLIKPFIALAWLHEAKAGRKPYGAAEQRRMEDMIRNSGNISASWFMRHLGGPSGLQRLLQNNYSGIFRDLRLVEYIPRSGRTFRNQASAHDYSRFLHALWKDELPGAAEIKRLMGLPNADRLYTAAPGVPPGTEVYDKTGTTSRLCGDMGIMVARRPDGSSFPYIIVGIIEKARSTRRYGNWMRSRGDIIRRVSEMVYEGITELHDFDGAASFSAGGGKGGAGGGS